MTPLDQAFAKAFSQRDPGRVPSRYATRAVPLAEALGCELVRPAASLAVQHPSVEDHKPAPPQAKPSGIVPAPHFALHRPMPLLLPEPEVMPDPELELLPEPEVMAESEPECAAKPEAAVEPVVEAVLPVPAEAAPTASGAVEEFTAGLQVDHFSWPQVCCRLITAAHDELDHLAAELKQLAGPGRVVAIAAPERGTGATSVLLCVAQRLAVAGLSTVAVDGDLDHPQLGAMLGLVPECGWEEVLAGQEALEEVLIESVDDRMTVLPLLKPVPPSRELPGRVAQSLATLCAHYDTVLWNMGPADDWWVLGDLVDRRLAEQIGLLLVVVDSRHDDEQLQRICRKAAAAGIEQIVLVENFAGPPTS
jgi:Mrp family chromosome partitioning ATPase